MQGGYISIELSTFTASFLPYGMLATSLAY